MNDGIKNIIEDMKKVKTDYGQDSLSVEEVLNLPALDGYKILAGDGGLKEDVSILLYLRLQWVLIG